MVDADMRIIFLKKEGNNSLACSMHVWNEYETTLDYKFIQRERTLKNILEEYWIDWLEVKSITWTYGFVFTFDNLIAFRFDGCFIN